MAIFIDGAWEHWATQGPMYYLMANLAWVPYQDGEALMEDYYQRGFGEAAEEIKTYWTMMERVRESEDVEAVKQAMSKWEKMEEIAEKTSPTSAAKKCAG